MEWDGRDDPFNFYWCLIGWISLPQLENINLNANAFLIDGRIIVHGAAELSSTGFEIAFLDGSELYIPAGQPPLPRHVPDHSSGVGWNRSTTPLSPSPHLPHPSSVLFFLQFQIHPLCSRLASPWMVCWSWKGIWKLTSSPVHKDESCSQTQTAV